METLRILGILDLTTTHGRGVWNGMWRFAREAGGVEVIRHVRNNQLGDRSFDGAVCQIAWDDLAAAVGRAVMPVVNISNRYVGLPWPQVIPDDREVGRAVFTHFFELGHRRFAFFGIPTHNYSAERCAGFRDAAEAARVPFFTLPFNAEDEDFNPYTERYIGHLKMMEKPVALMACNDIMAARVLAYAKASGLRVPQDVAIIGVDNDTIYCETESPFLSSVELNAEAQGYESARIVVALIRGQNHAQRVLVAHRRIVLRESSGEFAVSDAEIRAVVAWIREGVQGGVRVTDILRQFPMSRRSLELRFQKALGTTPSEFIRKERIAYAARLLASSDTPIKEVSFKCGFPDPRQFCKSFKRVTKKSPSEYRNLHLEQGILG